VLHQQLAGVLCFDDRDTVIDSTKCTILKYAMSRPRTIVLETKGRTVSPQPSYVVETEELARA
jgi:hypothetical protein